MSARHVMTARRAGLPFAIVGLAVLAACSSGTSTSTPASGSTGTDALAACLAQNGVTMPERPDREGGQGEDGTPPTGTPPTGAPAAGQGTPPTAGSGQAPPGVDATTWAAAQKACASLAPTPPGGAAAS